MKKYIQQLRHNKHIAKTYVEKKLLTRLRIFLIISVIILGIGLYRVLIGELSIENFFLSFSLGGIAGYLLGRTFRIFWHDEDDKVVSQIDTLGIGFLILYIAIEIGKTWIFGHWLSGTELNSFVLVFLSGLLFGRYLLMRMSIKKVLILEKEKRTESNN